MLVLLQKGTGVAVAAAPLAGRLLQIRLHLSGTCADPYASVALDCYSRLSPPSLEVKECHALKSAAEGLAYLADAAVTFAAA